MSRALVTLAAVLALGSWAAADDAYYDVPLNELEIVRGAMPPAATAPSSWENPLAAYLQPYAVLAGPGEVYVWSWQPGTGEARRARQITVSNSRLLVKARAGQEVRGKLFLPNEQWTGMADVEFRLPAQAAETTARRAFYQCKAESYEMAIRDNAAGAPWFRHQARQARRELGQTTTAPLPAGRQPWERQSELEEIYALFTGGRAIAENLQLDRQWPAATQPSDLSVDVASITGITVNEADWQALLGTAQPKLDALARAIPADQHAVFLPSFADAMTLADEIEKQALRVLPLAEEGSQDAGTLQKYERQLGLSRTALARLLGPAVIASVALTGSDPYFRTGTDVAVLFEAKQPSMLEKLLIAQVALQAQAAGVKPRAGELEVKKPDGAAERVAYTEYRTPDRSMCAYVAVIGPAVVVTNSPAQLQRLGEVFAGAAPTLADLPEYKVFRSRYALGDADETALVFLSDATIRRWCGPRWRIGSARRTLAAALLADLQAQHADPLATASVQPRALESTDRPIPVDLGQRSLAVSGVQSSLYGNLDFLTPISELDLAEVTAQEAAMYERWRDGYQQNWRNFFDPIALRIHAGDRQLGLDLSIMPLIAGSEYRQIVELTQGAEIAPTAGDPHDAILHVVLAFNPQSMPMRQGAGFAMSMAQGIQVDPLGWIGQSVALYLDDDPIWAEMPADKERLDDFMETNWHRLPVALRVEVGSGLKLVGFLTAARAFVEQTSPGMTTWETLQHDGRPYVKVSSPVPTEDDPQATAAVYYFVTPSALTLTLSESVLKRAIDRWAASTQPSTEAPATQPAPSWLGKSLALRLQAQAARAIDRLSRNAYQQALRRASWGNLPALNEWKRLWPDEDPMAVHQRLWGVRLVEPAGGQYVWNEQFQTMESSVFGCPAAPKQAEDLPGPMGDIQAADLGLSFENQGLRARMQMQRSAGEDRP